MSEVLSSTENFSSSSGTLSSVKVMLTHTTPSVVGDVGPKILAVFSKRPKSSPAVCTVSAV